MTGNVFSWRGKDYTRFLIIKNHDLRTGFCALVIYVLNGIRKANSINAIPVIDFNKENTFFLFDERQSLHSIWEYFFEPVSPYSIEQIESWLESGKLRQQDVLYISAKEFGYLHHHDPERIATFWAWKTPNDKPAWMQSKRNLGKHYAKKYVKPKNHIVEKADKFFSNHLTANTIIGLHIRGTDFNYASPIAINKYIKSINEIINALTDKNYQIFVATDQQQYLDKLMETFSHKVVARDVTRSTTNLVPLMNNNVSGYQKGEEALIDLLLLSKCSFIIKGPAALGEIATWLTNDENAKIVDYAPECDFNKNHYSLQFSSFTQLNVAELSSYQLILKKAKETLIKLIYSWKISRMFYERSARIRRWLLH